MVGSWLTWQIRFGITGRSFSTGDVVLRRNEETGSQLIAPVGRPCLCRTRCPQMYLLTSEAPK